MNESDMLPDTTLDRMYDDEAELIDYRREELDQRDSHQYHVADGHWGHADDLEYRRGQ